MLVNRRRFALRIACAAALSAMSRVAWCGDTVRMVHSFSERSPVHLFLEELVPRMEAAADYNVRFEVYSAVELGAWDELMYGMFEGRYDFVLGPGSLFAAHRMDVGPLARSDLFRSFDKWKTFSGSVAEVEIGSLFEKYDLELMGSSWLASEHLVARWPIGSVEDLRGMRVRVGWGSAEHAELLEALGAKAVKIPVSESYAALIKGDVDALVEPIGWTDLTFRYASGGTIIRNWIGGHVGWLVGRKNWQDDMDPFAADLVKMAITSAMIDLGDHLEELEESKLDELTGSGMEVFQLGDRDMRVFRDAVRQSWRRSLDSEDRRIAELIDGW